MRGGHDIEFVFRWVQHLTAMSGKSKVVTQQCFCGSGSEEYHDVGIDDAEFGEQPRTAGDDLRAAGRLVDPALVPGARVNLKCLTALVT
ncbi:hypothetical protein ASE48_21330 [Mycobacterium sp. Root265]|nr:hypothetical protein ASE48_21330 [Mycobacterium sp. Root265]